MAVDLGSVAILAHPQDAIAQLVREREHRVLVPGVLLELFEQATFPNRAQPARRVQVEAASGDALCVGTLVPLVDDIVENSSALEETRERQSTRSAADDGNAWDLHNAFVFCQGDEN